MPGKIRDNAKWSFFPVKKVEKSKEVARVTFNFCAKIDCFAFGLVRKTKQKI